MHKRLAVFVFLITFLVFTGSAFAIVKPTPPPAPTAPPFPEIPAPPDISGVYEVPEKTGMKVRVFAHPAKPTPPPRPGTSPSPSPSAAVSNLLVCGLTDPDSSSVVGKAGWRIPDGNITYLLNTSSVPSTVGSGNLAGIVKSGFDQYKSASFNKINFVQGSNTSANRARLDGKNIISWGRASSGTLGVTYVWYYPSTGLTAEIDTIMNNRYKWSFSNSLTCADNASYDAKNIMIHELGHWMGLDDEYNFADFGNNTLYGYGSLGEVKKSSLTAGDILGVGAIYSP